MYGAFVFIFSVVPCSLPKESKAMVLKSVCMCLQTLAIYRSCSLRSPFPTIEKWFSVVMHSFYSTKRISFLCSVIMF